MEQKAWVFLIYVQEFHLWRSVPIEKSVCDHTSAGTLQEKIPRKGGKGPQTDTFFAAISLVALKGQCHEMMFYEGLNFRCRRWWFSRSFISFSLPFTVIYFYLLLWNYLLILKMFTESLLRIPFSVIGRCSLVTTLTQSLLRCWYFKIVFRTLYLLCLTHCRGDISEQIFETRNTESSKKFGRILHLILFLVMYFL
jgi:hypothetical protein